MPLAQSNGIEIAYETCGDASNPALLLVMGVGCQLVLWDPEFCELLAERGFHVIRFDNRDVGLSSKIEGGPVPDLMAALAGDTSSAGYTLDDMAADTVGLLDALNVDSAHLVGASMGGMIAQLVAAIYPERALSLVSIMSTTGNGEVGQPLPTALPALIGPSPGDRDAYAEFAVRAWSTIGSPGYPREDDYVRRRALESYDRCHYPIGFLRQLLGIMASGDRSERLAGIRVPTLVIHGEADPLITVSGGEATAEAIPGARLWKIPGMGHDLPRELWPDLVDAIVANAERAREASPAESA